MKRIGHVVVGATLLLGCSGCSFIFVSSPSREPVGTAGETRVNCTTGVAAPVLDTVFAVAETARTIYALQASENDYQGATISRGADIGLGLALTTLFISSAVYGFTNTSKCTRMLRKPRPDDARSTVPFADVSTSGEPNWSWNGPP